jgi:hypothetical protein
LSLRLAAIVVLLAIVGLAAPACSKDHGSQERFCAQLPNTPDLSSLLQQLGTASPSQLEKQLSDGSDQFHELAKDAPKQIKADTERVRDTVDEILDAVRAHIDDPKALRAELAARKAHLLAVGPAAQRVVDYAADACGIELGGITTTGSTTSTTKP